MSGATVVALLRRGGVFRFLRNAEQGLRREVEGLPGLSGPGHPLVHQRPTRSGLKGSGRPARTASRHLWAWC
jgi:hypothetical protein